MKRAFIVITLLLIASVAINYFIDHKDDEKPYLERLKHTFDCADWQTHSDADYGYEMRFLSCFRRDENGERGSVRYVYVEEVSPLQSVCYITQEVHTEVCKDSLCPEAEIRERAKALGGLYLKQSDDSYLMSGMLISNDKYVTAYKYNAKWVLCQHLWFVQTLIYPEDFATAAERIVHEVDEWQPFSR